MIDGADAIDCCYQFAGIVGLHPKGLTLRQLWRMANGKAKQARMESAELASLVWGPEIDMENYLHFGVWEQTGRGGAVELSPDVETKVQAEIERLRREDPTLPKMKVM